MTFAVQTGQGVTCENRGLSQILFFFFFPPIKVKYFEFLIYLKSNTQLNLYVCTLYFKTAQLLILYLIFVCVL